MSQLVTEPAAGSRAEPRDTAGFVAPRYLTLALTVVAIVAGEVATWLLLRSQGLDITGDSPHYLIQAQTLAHLHLDPVPFYLRDFKAQYVYKWSQSAGLVQAHIFHGKNGPVFDHGLGLPALLAPFTAVGSVPGALLGFFAVNAVALTWLHQRVSRLAALGRRQQVLLALAFAAPAVFMAGTQILQDLLAGIVLACALVEVAWVERTSRASAGGMAVAGSSLALLPWLEVKNGVPAVLALAALLVAAFRSRAGLRAVGAAAGAACVSWAALLAYNLYYFGQVTGLPEKPERLNGTTLLQMATLLLDRHQGLLIQVPTVALGLLGVWRARRLAPAATVAAVVCASSLIVVNGAQFNGGSLGGVSLAGRFEWSAVPVLLAWSAFALTSVPARRCLVIGGAVGALWIWQGLPVVLADHVLLNSIMGGVAPWDPRLYPGWWPGLNGALPVFLEARNHLAVTAAGVAFVLCALTSALLVAARLTTDAGPRFAPPAAAGLLAVGLAAVTFVVAPRSMLPAPIRWPSSPWTASALTAASSGSTPVEVPVVEVGPGSYQLVLGYAAPAGASGKVVVYAVPYERRLVAGWLDASQPTDAKLLHLAPAVAGPPAQVVDTVALRSSAGRNATDVVTFQVPFRGYVFLGLLTPGGSVWIETVTFRAVA